MSRQRKRGGVTEQPGGTIVGRRRFRGVDGTVAAGLLAVSAVGWWWSVRMSTDMVLPGDTGPGDLMGETAMSHSLSFEAFLVAWLAMMAAMMLPAIAPVLSLYRQAAARRRVAPVPFFAVAYLVVWGALAVPAYVAWRGLQDPLANGATWAARLAGVVLLAAAGWQLTPLKSVCLRHCRSPLSFFLRYGAAAMRPRGAFRMGATHGAFCVGCCWALMAVLVAVGTMNLGWMALLAGLIFLEKNAAFGARAALVAVPAFTAAGIALLIHPPLLGSLT